MIMPHLMEKAPGLCFTVAVREDEMRIHEIGGDVQAGHDRVATVHIPDTDLLIGAVALRPRSVMGNTREVGITVQYLVPKCHEGFRVV